MKSTLFSIQWSDLLKGFVTAAITAALATITLAIEAGTLPTLTQLKQAGIAGLLAGIGYVIKNFFTNTTAVAEKRINEAGGQVIPNTFDK